MSQKYFNFNCKNLKDLDLFSKTPELYYKGKSQKSALIGRIFTVIYAIIYAAFFIYKVIRMYLKIDVSFYETETYTGEIPSLKLNNDLFYGGFALQDPTTGKTFIDETIYYPVAIFRMGHKDENNEWIWEDRILGTEKCKLEKFGSKFRSIFADKLDNMYCLSDVDVTIQGHTTYDVYSFFYVLFYPCVNGVNYRTNCQPYDKVAEKLQNTFLTVKMQDIELTPQLYKNPVQVPSRELSAPVMENLYNNINAYFHIVSIETDNDILGFEALSKIDVKRYFKYDVTFMVNSINNNSPLLTGAPYANILLQLTEQMITIDRTYTKLIEVLGDVGGLMEFVFSFLKILSLFLTEALYEKGLVNHLFSFDIDKKIISVKSLKKNKINNFDLNESPNILQIPKIYEKIEPLNKFSSQNNISNEIELTKRTHNQLNEDFNFNKNKIGNEKVLAIRVPSLSKKKKKIKLKKKATFSSKMNKIEINHEINTLKSPLKSPKNENLEKEIELSYRNKETNKGKENENSNIIDKFNFTKVDKYLCCICIRKRTNMPNILIDEGMRLISECLDIINIFKRAHLENQLLDKIDNEEYIQMSDECKKSLKKVYKSSYPK